MASSLFLALIFFFILFFFGWQLARRFLKENKIENLLGLSGIFGIGLYIFFINALGYFMPIQKAFYLVLFLFFALALALLYSNRSKSSLEWDTNKKWRIILFGTILSLVAANGAAYLRYPPILHEPGGLPITATIADGNFPILEIWYPKNNLRYHYSLEIFSAAVYKTTGLPIYFADSFQVAILSGILFLLGFCLIKKFFDNNNFKAFFSSLLMMYAGGLVFLNGLRGIPILYNLYIRHQQISTPFGFVTDSTISRLSVPTLISMVSTAWGSLTFPLILTVLYLYFYLINQGKDKMTILLCGVLLAVLPLASETLFPVLCFILLIYPFAFNFVTKDWQKAKNFFSISFWILLIATPLAFIQGGFLRSILDGLGARITNLIGIGNGLFKVNDASWVPNYIKAGYFPFIGAPFFNIDFYIQLAPLIALLIVSSVYLLKKNFHPGFFLVIFSAVSFFIPIFFTYDFFAYIARLFHLFCGLGDMPRFFYIINFIGGLAIGFFLTHLYLSSKKRWQKIGVIFVIIILMAQGLFFQLLYLTVGYPRSSWNAAAKYYAEAGSYEKMAYDWVKENTTVDDLFMIVKDCDYFSDAATNYRFIINTGRMAPIYSYHCSYPENDSFKQIKKDCAPSAIKDLNYSYLYVDEKWVEGLEDKCLANNRLELKFQTEDKDSFVRIYKVSN